MAGDANPQMPQGLIEDGIDVQQVTYLNPGPSQRRRLRCPTAIRLPELKWSRTARVKRRANRINRCSPLSPTE
mgnify:CR=1 FL=1